jgi:hypothetical protein
MVSIILLTEDSQLTKKIVREGDEDGVKPEEG